MIQKPSRLEDILGTPLNQIYRIIDNIDEYYSEYRDIKKDKNGNIKYKFGKPQFRIIRPSKGDLKILQSKINRRILSKIPLPDYIHGAVKGKDNISNARLHRGKKYHFCTDLKDFYPSVSHIIVYNVFINLSFSPDVSRILTKLTTYKGSIPQGAPTSSAVANLAFLPADMAIKKLCDTHGIIYTRYVDDLSFSSQTDSREVQQDIISIIRSHGYKISHRKTFAKIGPTAITGIVTRNNVLKPREDQIRKLSDPILSEDQRRGLKNYIDRIKNSK